MAQEIFRRKRQCESKRKTVTKKKDHASRNEARRLTCICLTAAHIHGTILLFFAVFPFLTM
jgi:hypothetical protein